MPAIVYDEWGVSYMVCDQVHETEKPTHSRILGPDGEPLAYDRPKVGFDLKKRKTSMRHPAA